MPPKATLLTQPSQGRGFQCAPATKSPPAAACPSLQPEKYFLCDKNLPISHLCISIGDEKLLCCGYYRADMSRLNVAVRNIQPWGPEGSAQPTGGCFLLSR